MNPPPTTAWPDDDGATLVALRGLRDPSPVPPLPLTAVVRRGRRRLASRTVSGLGVAAAAALVTFLLLPGTGEGASRIGPATQLTSTTLDPGTSSRWLGDVPPMTSIGPVTGITQVTQVTQVTELTGR